jgi:hypothetical protein
MILLFFLKRFPLQLARVRGLFHISLIIYMGQSQLSMYNICTVSKIVYPLTVNQAWEILWGFIVMKFLSNYDETSFRLSPCNDLDM